MKGPVCLIILDGFGIGDGSKGDAIALDGEAGLSLADGEGAEVLVFDLAA